MSFYATFQHKYQVSAPTWYLRREETFTIRLRLCLSPQRLPALSTNVHGRIEQFYTFYTLKRQTRPLFFGFSAYHKILFRYLNQDSKLAFLSLSFWDSGNGSTRRPLLVSLDERITIFTICIMTLGPLQTNNRKVNLTSVNHVILRNYYPKFTIVQDFNTLLCLIMNMDINSIWYQSSIEYNSDLHEINPPWLTIFPPAPKGSRLYSMIAHNNVILFSPNTKFVKIH